MPAELRVGAKDRKRLIVALLAAPVIVALPSLWPHLSESGFAVRHFDQLLIFFALPYAAALWLYISGGRRPR